MNKSILVIENECEVRQQVSDLLELAGYHVHSTASGMEGLSIAKKHKPDLIVCDVVIPDLDGYGILRAIQNIPELVSSQFVFLTSKVGPADFRLGMDLGADDYLTKPFSGDDLLKVVQHRLRKASLLKDNHKNTLQGLTGFFSDLKDNKELLTLANQKTMKRMRKREIVFAEGDLPNYLFFIVTGKVKLFKMNDYGKEYIVDIRGEGEFFGYNAILGDNPYKNSCMTLENTELSLIPKSDFLELLVSNTQISLKFIKFVSNSLSEAENKLLHLAYNSARKRVAEALLFVHHKFSSDGDQDSSFNLLRENLSAIAGISPESVSRNLTNFRDEGLIETNNGSIKILSLKKLELIKN